MTTIRVRFQTTLPPRTDTLFSVEAVGGGLPVGGLAMLDINPAAAALAAFNAGLTAPAVVSDIGDALTLCLGQHRAMAPAMAPVPGAGAVRRDLRFNFANDGGPARDLPWESLRDANGFLAIDSDVAILREFGAPQKREVLRLLQNEPLRLLAVIAARGNDGRGEWAAILNAVQNAPASLPLEVLVLTSKPQLVADIQAMGHPAIQAGAVPDQVSALEGQIGTFRPHLAHFFCHGHANVAGKPLLEIEPSSAAFGQSGSVWFSSVELQKSLAGHAWVIVLNACSLAASASPPTQPVAGQTSSLCEQLVGHGFPRVIGMRDLVLPQVAHAFAEEFYRGTLDELSRLHAGGAGALDLGESFRRACRGIVSALSGGGPPHVAAAQRREWTLPILAVRDGEVDIRILRDTALDVEIRPDGPGMPMPESLDLISADQARELLEEIEGEIEGLNRFISKDTFTDSQKQQIRERIWQLDAQLRALAGRTL